MPMHEVLSFRSLFPLLGWAVGVLIAGHGGNLWSDVGHRSSMCEFLVCFVPGSDNCVMSGISALCLNSLSLLCFRA